MRYSPLKDRFEYFGVLPEPRNYHAAVYHYNFIYVIGRYFILQYTLQIVDND